MSAQARADSGVGGRDPRRNALLARLPASEYEGVVSRLSLFTPEIKHPVFKRAASLDYVYFPLDAVFSLVTMTDEGAVEIATIGNEGMLGLPAYLGSMTSADDVFCQIPGSALSLRVEDLRGLLTCGQLERLLGLYVQTAFIQMSQNVACNRLHSAAQRASRWLLMSHDRVERDEFRLTHEFLAQMLGVRRATVSDIARELQRRRLIDYRRGRITVTDREGLEETACECYRRIRDETERLLGTPLR